jgi:tetratricopeptide (TPR) repeat protein
LLRANWNRRSQLARKALQIKPEAPLYKMLGNALQAGGKIDEAKSCYVKAIEINPNFAEAYANYGSICAQQNSGSKRFQLTKRRSP